VFVREDSGTEQRYCVIVGRGSQQFLKDRTDTMRVFLYAPMENKVQRLLKRGKSDSRALPKALHAAVSIEGRGCDPVPSRSCRCDETSGPIGATRSADCALVTLAFVSELSGSNSARPGQAVTLGSP
jgi:hypothetical protein